MAEMQTPTTRETLRVWPDVCQILGIGKNSAYRLARAGVLPVLRVGRRLLVPRRALEQLLSDPEALRRVQQGLVEAPPGA